MRGCGCHGWLVAVLLGLSSACSVLVDPSVLSIKCEVSPGGAGNDPCLSAGMHCVASECRPCGGGGPDGGTDSEICNGIDDDCDGQVDEGHDNDNDGFTWCGGGHPELRDCAPDDPSIHPAGQGGLDRAPIAAPAEGCDGKDNDCDMKVDEGSGCSGARPACSKDKDCSAGQRCDVAAGVCIEPRTVGSGCSDDSQCAGGFCLKKGQYDLNVELSGNRCAIACCTDADCGAGSVCVGGDSGVRVCLPANIAARGLQPVGSSCTGDAQCNSGACIDGRCMLRCSSSAGCEGSVCTLSLGSIREPRRWGCVSDENALGRVESGGACSVLDPTGCRSGLCFDGNCAGACGRDADCSPDSVCSTSTVRALFGPVSPVSFCVPKAASDSLRLCCTNADCGTENLCAPASPDGRFWTMACR